MNANRKLGGEKIWVVVADQARVRLFEALGADAPLAEIEVLDNPDAGARESELHRHLPGRGSNRATGRQAALGARETAKHQVAEDFARSVCRRLDARRRADTVDRVHLVAEPRMLGLLRAHMTVPTARLVASEMAKDPGRMRLPGLRKVLPAQL